MKIQDEPGQYDYPNTEKITRVEVIDEDGRSYVKYGVTSIEFSLQDDDCTLKIFLKTKSEELHPLLDSATDAARLALWKAGIRNYGEH